VLKKIIKKYFLKYFKSIELFQASNVNFDIINTGKKSVFGCKIINSEVSFTTINEGCIISDSKTYGDIRLGRFVTITGPGTVIKALHEYITIGSFSSIGQNVCILDFNHDFNKMSSSFINHLIYKTSFTNDIITKGPIIIEEDVFIGSNSIILAGASIGRGSIIGAGSIVTKNIPKYSIVAGNPAKIISKRFDDSMIEYLENLKWWEWDIKKIKENKNLFSVNLNDYRPDLLESIIN